jgi:ElaB/YqjD/DUF883 family membrane-anchored ribosome-binding protein
VSDANTTLADCAVSAILARLRVERAEAARLDVLCAVRNLDADIAALEAIRNRLAGALRARDVLRSASDDVATQGRAMEVASDANAYVRRQAVQSVTTALAWLVAKIDNALEELEVQP